MSSKPKTNSPTFIKSSDLISVQNSVSPIPSTISVQSNVWKTFTDTKNRFSFKYPETFVLSSSSDYEYIYYLETPNYKPFREGSYKIQIEITSNNGIPKVVPSIDSKMSEAELIDKLEFVKFSNVPGVKTSYKEVWKHYLRYDMYSDHWKVDFFGTGTDHVILDQILSTFQFI